MEWHFELNLPVLKPLAPRLKGFSYQEASVWGVCGGQCRGKGTPSLSLCVDKDAGGSLHVIGTFSLVWLTAHQPPLTETLNTQLPPELLAFLIWPWEQPGMLTFLREEGRKGWHESLEHSPQAATCNSHTAIRPDLTNNQRNINRKKIQMLSHVPPPRGEGWWLSDIAAKSQISVTFLEEIWRHFSNV